jgi:hypothetical protein
LTGFLIGIASMDAIPSLAMLKELVRELERLDGQSSSVMARMSQFHPLSADRY